MTIGHRQRNILRRVLPCALLLAMAWSGAARGQSISLDKPVYGGDDIVRISYTTPAECRCELRIIALSRGLRSKSYDAWIAEAFYQGGVTRQPLFLTENETSQRVAKGGAATFEYATAKLRAFDRGRAWFLALLIDNTTEIIAQAPFLVVRRYATTPVALELTNEAGTPIDAVIGTPSVRLRLPAAANTGPMRADFRRVGAATSLRSWNLETNAAIGLQRDIPAPGLYDVHFTSSFPEFVVGMRQFEVSYPYDKEALKLSPVATAAYPGNKPPKVDIVYPAGGFDLVLARVDGAKLDRVWGWEVGSSRSVDLASRLPATLLPLPAGTYELRLYMGGAASKGPYLLSRRQFAITGSAAPAVAAPPPMAGQASISGGGSVNVGDSFSVSYDAPGDGPVWLALYPKPYFAATCTILEAAPPTSIAQSWIGNARFQYPVALASAGTAELIAPWMPGDYELRIYRGEMPNDERSLASPKARLIASTLLQVVLPAPPFTFRTTAGPVVQPGTSIDIEIETTKEMKRDFYKVWRVEVAIMRATEHLPGGAVIGERHVGVTENIDGRISWVASETVDGRVARVRLPPLHVDPGPHNIIVTATSPDGAQFRYVARHQFHVPPPSRPALPADAAYRRGQGFAPPDGYSPLPAPTDCALGTLAALLGQPPAAIPIVKPVQPKPTLTIVEWIGGKIETVDDDRYVPAAKLFPGHPYVVEARFAEAQSAETYTVQGPGNSSIVVKRTRDPLVYRSELIVFAPKQNQ